jgi:hypothetical protein
MPRYASPWDRALKLTTGLVVLLVGAIGLATLFLRSSVSGDPVAGRMFLAVPIFCVVLLLGLWALAPQGFSIERGAIRVERALRPVEIPLRDVVAAGVLPDGGLGRAVRVFGASGAFGHYGRFWSRPVGHFRMYATRSHGLVRILSTGGTFILSPEPAARFVEEVLARAPAARLAGDTRPEPPRAQRSQK